jgi:hypothetical protein
MSKLERLSTAEKLALLSDERHPFVSDGYEFVNTKHIVSELDRYGFQPVLMNMVEPRNDKKIPFTKYTVAFQRIDDKPVNGVIPQLHVINSYDGSSSLRFEFGMLRLVCSNGLVMRDGHTEEIRMKHDNIYASIDQVIGMLNDGFHNRQERITMMENRHLSIEEARGLARAGIELKHGTQDLLELNIDEVIRPNRFEDQGMDLWKTFNTIQENLIKGNKSIKYRGNDRAIRDKDGQIIEVKPQYRSFAPIRDFDKRFQVNKNLFDKALEMVS